MATDAKATRALLKSKTATAAQYQEALQLATTDLADLRARAAQAETDRREALVQEQ